MTSHVECCWTRVENVGRFAQKGVLAAKIRFVPTLEQLDKVFLTLRAEAEYSVIVDRHMDNGTHEAKRRGVWPKRRQLIMTDRYECLRGIIDDVFADLDTEHGEWGPCQTFLVSQRGTNKQVIVRTPLAEKSIMTKQSRLPEAVARKDDILLVTIRCEIPLGPTVTLRVDECSDANSVSAPYCTCSLMARGGKVQEIDIERYACMHVEALEAYFGEGAPFHGATTGVRSSILNYWYDKSGTNVPAGDASFLRYLARHKDESMRMEPQETIHECLVGRYENVSKISRDV